MKEELHMKKLGQIINLKTFIVALMSVASTYFCIQNNLIADFPFTIITTAVVFPIVFSISGAYKRRESALNDYSSLKAHGKALYLASRDWLENSTPEIQSKFKSLLEDLFDACHKTFTDERNDLRENEAHVYKTFSNISEFIKDDLRANGLASGECSRCNQYLSKMMLSFENAKHIYQYRTPTTLRAFSDLFIILLPFVYGPYFAFLADEASKGLGYVMPVLFSVVLVALDNIQSHLENPFDQVGEDDIVINTDLLIQRLK